jgi:hypothetical protein
MTPEEVDRFIDSQEWRFASTMPQWPHWYCLRRSAQDSEQFRSFVRHIRQAGYSAEFRPERADQWAVRRYLDHGDFHYWTMDALEDTADLINRARHPNVAVRTE